MKKILSLNTIVLTILLLLPTYTDAQDMIFFRYFMVGFGQYKEVKDDLSKLSWSQSEGTVQIDQTNKTIKIGHRNFVIAEKISHPEGYVFGCYDLGGEKCRISYSYMKNRNIHVISIEQNGVMFTYTNYLGSF